MHRVLRPLLFVLTTSLAGFALLAGSEVPRPDSVRLDDFQELQNPCGGYRNAFFREPSSEDARRFSTLAGGDRSLKIEVDCHAGGFCGA
jgi:hypothetical protein